MESNNVEVKRSERRAPARRIIHQFCHRRSAEAMRVHHDAMLGTRRRQLPAGCLEVPLAWTFGMMGKQGGEGGSHHGFAHRLRKAIESTSDSMSKNGQSTHAQKTRSEKKFPHLLGASNKHARPRHLSSVLIENSGPAARYCPCPHDISSARPQSPSAWETCPR